MLIFFDTEFTGLKKGAELISLGMITDQNKRFYAEFTDFNRDDCDDFVEKDVIQNLRCTHHEELEENSTQIWAENETFVYGDTGYIMQELRYWLYDQYLKGGKDRIQLVSDVCHFDMYLLVTQLFGDAFNFPDYVNPVCYDICQDLCARAEYLTEETEVSPGVTVAKKDIAWYPDMQFMPAAFDVSREQVCMYLHGKLPAGVKHNALYDAEVIKMIYEGQRGVKE